MSRISGNNFSKSQICLGLSLASMNHAELFIIVWHFPSNKIKRNFKIQMSILSASKFQRISILVSATINLVKINKLLKVIQFLS